MLIPSFMTRFGPNFQFQAAKIQFSVQSNSTNNHPTIFFNSITNPSPISIPLFSITQSSRRIRRLRCLHLHSKNPKVASNNIRDPTTPILSSSRKNPSKIEKSHQIAEIQYPYPKENLKVEFKLFLSIRFPSKNDFLFPYINSQAVNVWGAGNEKKVFQRGKRLGFWVIYENSLQFSNLKFRNVHHLGSSWGFLVCSSYSNCMVRKSSLSKLIATLKKVYFLILFNFFTIVTVVCCWVQLIRFYTSFAGLSLNLLLLVR